MTFVVEIIFFLSNIKAQQFTEKGSSHLIFPKTFLKSRDTRNGTTVAKQIDNVYDINRESDHRLSLSNKRNHFGNVAMIEKKVSEGKLRHFITLLFSDCYSAVQENCLHPPDG